MARQIDLDHTPDKDGGLNDYEWTFGRWIITSKRRPSRIGPARTILQSLGYPHANRGA